MRKCQIAISPRAAEDMAESGSNPSSIVQKVCIGEQKRPVTYTVDGTIKERKALLAAAKQVYADVTSLEVESDIVVQVKNEQWEGEFVDLGDEEIPDRGVLRVAVEVNL